MTDKTYNGWTNWDTWSINLYWGDYWSSLADDGEEVTADTMRSDVEAFIDEALASMPEGQRLFISDWMNLSAVNWNELARHYERESEAA